MAQHEMKRSTENRVSARMGEVFLTRRVNHCGR